MLLRTDKRHRRNPVSDVKNVSLSVSLPKALYDRVVEVSQERKTNKSAVVVRALVDALCDKRSSHWRRIIEGGSR
jgi:hypothetical protein